MTATDLIRLSLESATGWTMGLIDNMRDAPLAQASPHGNHPLWVLGHIARAESDLLDGFILGKPNRFPELEAFAMGSAPSVDGSQYPTIDELMAKFQTIRNATLAHLASLTDADLSQGSHAPEEFGPAFATVGGVFAAMAIHMTFHGGQVAEARRSLGRAPLMA